MSLEGVGLHTGEKVAAILCPAEGDEGIRFMQGEAEVCADLSTVSSTYRGISLRSESLEVQTVEHLMAACLGAGIDNLRVKLKGPELPIGDGSCLPFWEALSSAGKVELNQPRKEAMLTQPVWATEGEQCLVALPAPSLEVTFAIHFQHPLIGSQLTSFTIEEEIFRQELAPARTFGFFEEAEKLWAANRALGASVENVLVIYPDHFSSPPRFEDEIVRHKIVDLLGDIALIGADLRCRLLAIKTGHRLNNKLAQAMVKFLDFGGRR